MAYSIPRQLYGGNQGAAIPSQYADTPYATDLPLPTSEISKKYKLKPLNDEKIINAYLQNLLPAGQVLRNQNLQSLYQLADTDYTNVLEGAGVSNAISGRENARNSVLANLASRGLGGSGIQRNMLRSVESDYLRNIMQARTAGRQQAQSLQDSALAGLSDITAGDLRSLQLLEAGKSAGQKQPIYGLGYAIGGAARGIKDSLLGGQGPSQYNYSPSTYGGGGAGYGDSSGSYGGFSSVYGDNANFTPANSFSDNPQASGFSSYYY